MIEASVKQFLKELSEIEDNFNRQVRRFQLDLAMQVLKQAQENIKKNFGSGRGQKSPITEMSYGNSARGAGRGGALMRSGNIEAEGSRVNVSFGGPGVPYAAIHEEGGVIVPKSAKFLTIPFSSRTRGARAREFDLKYAVDPVWGRVLKFRGASRKGDQQIAFLLRKKSTIPARPYLQPAVDKVTADPYVQAMMLRLLGRKSIGGVIVL